MSAPERADYGIDAKALDGQDMPALAAFLESDGVLPYLPAERAPAELAALALADPAQSIVQVWRFASGELAGAAGLFIRRERNEAELWVCTARAEPHYWIAVAATKLLASEAFDRLELAAVRAQCARADRQTADALGDHGFAEDGVQRGNLRWNGAWTDRTLFALTREDWLAASDPKRGNWFVQCRPEDRGPFQAFALLQALLLAALIYLAFLTVGWFGALPAAAYVAVVVRVDWLLYRRIRDEQRYGMRALSFGFLCAAAFSVLLLLQAAYRIRWDDGVSISWTGPALVLLALALLHRSAWYKARQRKVPWFWLGALLLGLPLWAWMSLSAFAGEWASNSVYTQGWTAWRERAAERAEAVAERRQWQAAVPARVAVALSGGGYRAALIHAGVLAELDRQRVPITYLSTVSGGSIIGAYYALGYRPADFIRATRDGKPGLLYSKLSFFQVVSGWLWPGRSDADDYANHFARFYFGKASLHDLPQQPVLLANVTDLEAAPADAREVLFRERAELLPDLARTIRVADAVAASGAFPGAFDPKTIAWFPQGALDAAAAPAPRRFVDGGVVENMGLEGLRRYLRWRRAMKLPLDKPDVLIVSDASRMGAPVPLAPKPALTGLLARVQEISYSGFQQSLLGRYTGQTDFGRWMESRDWDAQVAEVPYAAIDGELAEGQPEVLRVVVIPATWPQLGSKLGAVDPARCGFGGRSMQAVQREVAGFGTLKELEAEDVEKAAWLGSALAERYAGAVRCAVGKASGHPAPCNADAKPFSCRPSNAVGAMPK
jgi:predicted acylesterase/phospholipase RssA/RimJ/RimL family protein N-acetyltransferase